MGRIQPATIATILGAALSLGALASALRVGPSASAPSFVAVSVSDAVDEESLVRALKGAGFVSVVTESAQSVLLNDFGEVQSVPLNRYRDYVEPFDPRDDGYAERLRRVFVSGGVRRAFLPLGLPALFRNPRNLGERLRRLFPEQKAEVYVQVAPRPLLTQSIVLVSALIVAFFWAERHKLFLPLLPILFALGFLGAAGLVLAGLALALFRTLQSPARELARSRSPRNLMHGFSAHLATAFGFAAFFLALGIGSGTDALSLALSLTGTVVLAWALPFVADSRNRDRGHQRFLPLALLRPRVDFSGPGRAMLPFAAAALSALVMNAAFAVPGGAEKFRTFLGQEAGTITADDFQAHLSFQRNFSLLPLGRGNGGAEPGYYKYELGSDGLIAGRAPVAEESASLPDGIADTAETTERLLSILDASVHGGALGIRWGEVVAVIFIVSFSLPASLAALRRKGRNSLYSILDEKQVAA